MADQADSTVATRRAVLLDVDGTLLDSNDQHAHAWVDALRTAGVSRSFDEVRPLIGMGGDKLIPRLSGFHPDSAAGKQLSERRTQCFMQDYLAQVTAFPDVRVLLEKLHAAGYTLCVATSAKRDELEALLKQGGILDLLPQRTSADDAERSKPDPDIVVAALRSVGCAPEQAFMLGDTPYDAEAAQRARVPFIGLLSGGHPASAFQGARAVYRDATELLAHFAELPA
jgi:phosphoglycolate phosphatase-like HAD superfamily hydrolase